MLVIDVNKIWETQMLVVGIILVLSAILLKTSTGADIFIPISGILAIVGIYILLKYRKND